MTTPAPDAPAAPLLSAVMIVRDEQARLARCLRSLQAVADEIVVVDTGSTDDTVAIAEAHGCTVGHFPWVGDFAAARNHSLDLARGAWVLMIDADETVAAGTAEGAEQLLGRAADHVALTVGWCARPGLAPMQELRLWRNRPDVRFRGIIHEHVVDDLMRLVAAGIGTIGRTDLVLDHDGYEGDQTHKLARDLPLLEAEIASGRDRPYLRQHQGAILLTLGRVDEARAAWERGAALAIEQGRFQAQDCGCHHQLIVHGIDRGWDVQAIVDEAWHHFDHGLIAWARLLHGEVTGDDAAVVEAATRLIGGPLPQDAGSSVDPRLYGPWPLVARAKAALRRGDAAAAVADLLAAEAEAPWVHEYRVLRQGAEALAATSGTPRCA